ncbi:hypothetical protein QOT17_018172 [Balamuthia mandrillaris]
MEPPPLFRPPESIVSPFSSKTTVGASTKDVLASSSSNFARRNTQPRKRSASTAAATKNPRATPRRTDLRSSSSVGSSKNREFHETYRYCVHVIENPLTHSGKLIRHAVKGLVHFARERPNLLPAVVLKVLQVIRDSCHYSYGARLCAVQSLGQLHYQEDSLLMSAIGFLTRVANQSYEQAMNNDNKEDQGKRSLCKAAFCALSRIGRKYSACTDMLTQFLLRHYQKKGQKQSAKRAILVSLSRLAQRSTKLRAHMSSHWIEYCTDETDAKQRRAGIKALGRACCPVDGVVNDPALEQQCFEIAQKVIRQDVQTTSEQTNGYSRSAAVQALSFLLRSNPVKWWPLIKPVFSEVLANPQHTTGMKASVLLALGKMAGYLEHPHPCIKSITDLLLKLSAHRQTIISEAACYALCSISAENESKYERVKTLYKSKLDVIEKDMLQASYDALERHLRGWCKLITKDSVYGSSLYQKNVRLSHDSDISDTSTDYSFVASERSESDNSFMEEEDEKQTGSSEKPTITNIVSDESNLLELCTYYPSLVLQLLEQLMGDYRFFNDLQFVHNLKFLMNDYKMDGETIGIQCEQTGLLKYYSALRELPLLLKEGVVAIMLFPLDTLDNALWLVTMKQIVYSAREHQQPSVTDHETIVEHTSSILPSPPLLSVTNSSLSPMTPSHRLSSSPTSVRTQKRLTSPPKILPLPPPTSSIQRQRPLSSPKTIPSTPSSSSPSVFSAAKAKARAKLDDFISQQQKTKKDATTPSPKEPRTRQYNREARQTSHSLSTFHEPPPLIMISKDSASLTYPPSSSSKVIKAHKKKISKTEAKTIATKEDFSLPPPLIPTNNTNDKGKGKEKEVTDERKNKKLEEQQRKSVEQRLHYEETAAEVDDLFVPPPPIVGRSAAPKGPLSTSLPLLSSSKPTDGNVDREQEEGEDFCSPPPLITSGNRKADTEAKGEEGEDFFSPPPLITPHSVDKEENEDKQEEAEDFFTPPPIISPLQASPHPKEQEKKLDVEEHEDADFFSPPPLLTVQPPSPKEKEEKKDNEAQEEEKQEFFSPPPLITFVERTEKTTQNEEVQKGDTTQKEKESFFTPPPMVPTAVVPIGLQPTQTEKTLQQEQARKEEIDRESMDNESIAEKANIDEEEEEEATEVQIVEEDEDTFGSDDSEEMEEELVQGEKQLPPSPKLIAEVPQSKPQQPTTATTAPPKLVQVYRPPALLKSPPLPPSLPSVDALLPTPVASAVDTTAALLKVPLSPQTPREKSAKARAKNARRNRKRRQKKKEEKIRKQREQQQKRAKAIAARQARESATTLHSASSLPFVATGVTVSPLASILRSREKGVSLLASDVPDISLLAMEGATAVSDVILDEKEREPQEKKRKRERKGSGGKKHQPVQKKPHVERPVIVCKFYLNGACHKGEECTFAHIGTPAKKTEICRFYRMNACLKGEECLFSHDLKQEPCKYFYKGKCAIGVTCKFSHDFPREEALRILAELKKRAEEERLKSAEAEQEREDREGTEEEAQPVSFEELPSLASSSAVSASSATASSALFYDDEEESEEQEEAMEEEKEEYRREEKEIKPRSIVQQAELPYETPSLLSPYLLSSPPLSAPLPSPSSSLATAPSSATATITAAATSTSVGSGPSLSFTSIALARPSIDPTKKGVASTSDLLQRVLK